DDASDVGELCEGEGQFTEGDTTHVCEPAGRLVEQGEDITPGAQGWRSPRGGLRRASRRRGCSGRDGVGGRGAAWKSARCWRRMTTRTCVPRLKPSSHSTGGGAMSENPMTPCEHGIDRAYRCIDCIEAERDQLRARVEELETENLKLRIGFSDMRGAARFQRS